MKKFDEITLEQVASQIKTTEAESHIGDDFYIALPKELANMHYTMVRKDKGRLFVRSVEIPFPDDNIDKAYDDFCKLENPEFKSICEELAYSYNEFVHSYNRFLEDSEL